MEVAATYTTEQLVITTADGEGVEGGPITEADGKTQTSYLGGPAVDLDVHPEAASTTTACST